MELLMKCSLTVHKQGLPQKTCKALGKSLFLFFTVARCGPVTDGSSKMAAKIGPYSFCDNRIMDRNRGIEHLLML